MIWNSLSHIFLYQHQVYSDFYLHSALALSHLSLLVQTLLFNVFVTHKQAPFSTEISYPLSIIICHHLFVCNSPSFHHSPYPLPSHLHSDSFSFKTVHPPHFCSYIYICLSTFLFSSLQTCTHLFFVTSSLAPNISFYATYFLSTDVFTKFCHQTFILLFSPTLTESCTFLYCQTLIILPVLTFP